MANAAADPKAAPLADDLKEFSLSLPASAFPKNFFCALCNQLAVDSWKLLCCNKVICSSCQANLQFPTTCPSCDHSPLEADSCTPNKALRNTMRVWLEKRKKKEEAKTAAQVATPPIEAAPAAPDAVTTGDVQDKPTESVEDTSKATAGPAEQAFVVTDTATPAAEGTSSASVQVNEDSTTPQIETGIPDSSALPNMTKNTGLSATDGSGEGQNDADTTNGTMMGNNPMMNTMQGQMGFGFPNQAGFNNGMGWNGMNQMNGMPNMMANNWNTMNPMDFNNMNGMYGNFGGNMGMGMGMNDMSSMSMMNYGGGYGNGWGGMGGGFGNGNFNGHNQMGGYNQSGAYPEMMNQFPKNNFPNQNQTRFHANQGGMLPQRNNRNGSFGGFGAGAQNANSRPGSRSGPTQNRDGQSPDGTAKPAPDAKAEGEQTAASAEPTEEGKEPNETPDSVDPQSAEGTGDVKKGAGDATDQAGDESNDAAQGGGLNQIQTVESVDADMEGFDQSMMGSGMQPNMAYPQGMMNQAQMNSSFDPSMNMGYHNSFGPRGGFNSGAFNNGAYGAATVLTGQTAEPVGVGVVGAPTGPRAMREGRPNTGFSSRVHSARSNPPLKSITPAQDAAPTSPQRRVRSRSPLRDESLRVKERSPTRSRSRSRSRERIDHKEEKREHSRSPHRESRREHRDRSPTPKAGEEYDHRQDRRHRRSSRQDDREEEYADRYRDDREDREDRTRDTSADSRHRSSRRDKDKHRSSRSHRDRSRENRHRHRSRSPLEEDRYADDDGYKNGEKDSDGSSRRKRRGSDKEKPRERDRSRDRDRERDREKDREDRKDRERERDYEHEREKDRSREKDRDRRRRRERDDGDDERDYDDDKYRSSRRSRKDRERERDKERDRDEREHRDKQPPPPDREEDVVSQLMKKRTTSPPLNAPTGPSANGFSIKGRSKNTPSSTTAATASIMPPPTAPRAFQPPKGPAADRNRDRDRSEPRDHHRRKSSASSASGAVGGPDHYAADRERNARERDSREKGSKRSDPSLHARMASSSSSSSATPRPGLASKRTRDAVDREHDDDDDDDDDDGAELATAAGRVDVPRGPKAETRARASAQGKTPTGPAGHRDKRRKSGGGPSGTGDDNIARLFTAGLRKNAKASRRGGVRTEGDVEREMERVERERDRERERERRR